MSHSHVLYDADPHFKIDPTSRNIINESSTKLRLIQHDHNSERFTFDCPRVVEGHDLAECNLVEIHYLNIEANTKVTNKGVYIVDDLQVKEDDPNTVVCSWVISNNATRLVGQLQFVIRFSCTDDQTGQIQYVWNTGTYTGIQIASGIFNGETNSDTPRPAYTFVTTVSGEVLKFFVGTKEEYDTLSPDEKMNIFALITDDMAKEEIDAAISALNEKFTELRTELTDGSLVVNKATNATNAENATTAKTAESATSAEKATKDAKGNEIHNGYLSLLPNDVRESTADQRLIVPTYPLSNGLGDVFLAEVVMSGITYNFGLIWYKSGTVVSTCIPDQNDVYRVLYLKFIEREVFDNETGARSVYVDLWAKSIGSTPKSEKITSGDTTIRIKCLRIPF